MSEFLPFVFPVDTLYLVNDAEHGSRSAKLIDGRISRAALEAIGGPLAKGQTLQDAYEAVRWDVERIARAEFKGRGSSDQILILDLEDDSSFDGGTPAVE
jgi:hypothetical protein